MAFRLRVFFSGLCMFVPVEENGKIVEVLVLFPNLKSDDRIREVTGSNFLKPHKTVLQFRSKNRVSQIPNYPYFFDAESQLNGLWELNGENLHIKAPDSKNQLDICVDKLMPEEKPPVEGEGMNNGTEEEEKKNETVEIPNWATRKDFFWVSPLRDEAGDLAGARPDFLLDPLDVPETIKDLRARMVIRGGKLFPAAFSGNGGQQKLLIYRVGNQLQAIATVVELRMRIASEQVMFQARRFKSAQTNDPPFVRKLVLAPEIEEGTGKEKDVEVWILNREEDEIIKQQPIPPNQHDLRHIQEFKFYKRLLENGVRCKASKSDRRRQEKCDPRFFQPDIQDETMGRLYFPTLSGEGGNVGGPCTPVTAKIEKKD